MHEGDVSEYQDKAGLQVDRALAAFVEDEVLKIEAALGWRPTVTIEEGLERHLRWGRETFGWAA